MDVKLSFLNGPLEAKVYIYQPPGFKIRGQEMVNMMRISLYGLNQDPKTLTKSIYGFLLKLGSISAHLNIKCM